MPRQPRIHVPGLIYHVMGRGIEGCKIFRDENDREGFLKRLADGIGKPGGPRLYAWALLSNHFHLLLRSGEENLSTMMRRLMTGHAVTYNLRHKRQGHLFQNRFKSIIVEEEPYFLELVRYIHLNPVRCGIVKDMEGLARHPYTGHSVIMGKRRYDAQDTNEVLSRFSAKRNKSIPAYDGFVAAGLHQGRRDELRGGGLIRSSGGIAGVMTRKPDEQELSDERILGSGDFVEAVLLNGENCRLAGMSSIDDILHEISEKSGISKEQILGPSRNRRISSARKSFFSEAHARAGVTLTMLARMTGRSHVAVRKAIDEVNTGGPVQ